MPNYPHIVKRKEQIRKDKMSRIIDSIGEENICDGSHIDQHWIRFYPCDGIVGICGIHKGSGKLFVEIWTKNEYLYNRRVRLSASYDECEDGAELDKMNSKSSSRTIEFISRYQKGFMWKLEEKVQSLNECLYSKHIPDFLMKEYRERLDFVSF